MGRETWQAMRSQRIRHNWSHTHTQKCSPYFKIVEDQNFISPPNICHFLLFFTVSLKNLQYLLQKILITFFLPEMFLFHIHSLKIIFLEKKIWTNKFEFLSALKVVSLFCIFHISEQKSTAFKHLQYHSLSWNEFYSG